MTTPKALIIRTAGTNCDGETKAAFELAGAVADRVHINRLISGDVRLADYQILAIPGGFSYGDDIASGRILANELKNKLGDQLRSFALAGKPVIGVCNGFQVLVKMGLLPDEKSFQQTTTLTFNDSDKFECRWVALKTEKQKGRKTRCLWAEDLPDVIDLPVAHGEGKFVAATREKLAELEQAGQVVFRYSDSLYPYNPNGSLNNIAGICNKKGNVFGLMPHPERFVDPTQHYAWTRRGKLDQPGAGLAVFQNAVAFVRKC
jgi:phosphoribosylformylglycinamidine synthase